MTGTRVEHSELAGWARLQGVGRQWVLRGLLVYLLLLATGVEAKEAVTLGTLELQRQFGLNRAEALAYQVLWVIDPGQVPEPMREFARVPPRGTTPILFQLKRRREQIPSHLLPSLQVLFDRPPKSLLPESVVSSGGHFRVHFSTSGFHSTTVSFAEQIASVFEHCWQVEVEQLRFRPPPSDFGVDGPEYDVYVMNINDYGYTNADREIPETPRDDWTSFIVVDNDFANPRYHTHGVPALQVTAAHEFFHAIHFGYRSFRDDDVFYYEASAVWMEDYVYDEVNDYYQYLPQFFERPDKPFDTYDGWHEYGLALWNKMLVRLYGVGIIREIWEQMLEESGLDAMSTVLHRHGDSFERALAEFQVWQYFTGSRADSVQYFRESAHYPELRFNWDSKVDSFVWIADSTRRLAGTFLHFQVEATGNWVASLESDLPGNWVCGVAVWDADGVHWAQTPVLARDLELGLLSHWSTFLIVPVNVSRDPGWPNQRLHFRLRVERRSRAAGPGFRVFDPAPNPFRPEEHGFAYIEYVLSESGDVRLYIRDERGVAVRREDLGPQPEGLRRIYRWDGRNDRGELVASGVYLIQIVTGRRTGWTKIAVIR